VCHFPKRIGLNYPDSHAISADVHLRTIPERKRTSPSRQGYGQYRKTYSCRRASTGFTSAARITWVLTVNDAMTSAENPPTANTVQPISVR
jgi:hypothetical protein